MSDPTLHPEMVAFWGDLARWPKFATMQDDRAFWDAWCLARSDPPPADMTVRDDTIAGPAGPIAVRLYRPAGVAATGAPCLVYCHGGGYVSGTLDSSEHMVWHLAAEAGVVVISVDYRLAPEHRFPAAFDDAFAAAAAVIGAPARFGIDGARVAVGGDSAGASLSAAVCLAARDRGGPVLAGQLLVYGAFGLGPKARSRTAKTNDPSLTEDSMAAYRRAYFGPRMTTDSPYGVPLGAHSHRGLPPAFLVAADCDPLRDESEAYADALRAAGVAVEHWIAPAMGHSFLRAWGRGPAIDAACARVAAFARRACGGSPA
jgi:acetyl esterase